MDFILGISSVSEVYKIGFIIRTLMISLLLPSN